MADFKIVDRSHIPAARGRGVAPSELSLALARGEVVFIAKPRGERPSNQVMNLFAKGSYVRKRGLAPKTRQGTEDGIEGVFVWAEKAGA